MKNLLVLILATFLVSCASKVKVMDASAVSMTHDSIKPGEMLTPMGEVTGEFCTDSSTDRGSVGLFDEALKKAQAESHADFILNASFWSKTTFGSSSRCTIVSGEGAKVVAAEKSKTTIR
jgi:hypothetical protein